MYRDESHRILATLIRLLGDFDIAEDALHDAFAAAARKWPEQGLPANTSSWLVSTGRFKAIDTMRRRSRFDSKLSHLAAELPRAEDPAEQLLEVVLDDQLRLMFACCHPALSVDARPALTLREVCGLTTEEIARAFLSSPSTVAQRIGRLLAGLLPEPEAIGLLALMLLQESRRAARTTQDGDLVLLVDQDRALWNRDQIAEGIGLVELYGLLLQAEPSPVVELNRAVAVAMRDGPESGLPLIDAILARGEMTDYHLAHSARAELC